MSKVLMLVCHQGRSVDSELFNPESKSTGGEEWQWQALLDPPEVDMVAVELLPTLEHEGLKRSLGVSNRPDLLLLVAVTADQLLLLHNITSNQRSMLDLARGLA